jgi:hypothetical protein
VCARNATKLGQEELPRRAVEPDAGNVAASALLNGEQQSDIGIVSGRSCAGSD